MPDGEVRKIVVEAPTGERFEAEVFCDTLVSKVATDFFESQGWPTQDHRGRGQRAVVELVNPNNPDDTKRLNSDTDICDAVQEGDVLRIFPESIAGAVDQKARTNALIADHNDMKALAERKTKIAFKANRSHAPDKYEITFHYTSFAELRLGDSEPLKTDKHLVEVILGAEYPRRAPVVHWLTPIFHPNIDPSDGEVCLGVLRERYLPGLGLARLTHMLAEMLQWRNFDALNAFNRKAAEWAINPDHWRYILAIGGHPFQGPIEELLRKLEGGHSSCRIQFRPVAR